MPQVRLRLDNRSKNYDSLIESLDAGKRDFRESCFNFDSVDAAAAAAVLPVPRRLSRTRVTLIHTLSDNCRWSQSDFDRQNTI